MHIHQLQHFALGDDVGGLCQHFHHAHAVGFDHHLEGARIQKVPDQYAGRITKGRVGRCQATAQAGIVDHVVVQQGGGVDKFDNGRQLQAPRVLAAQGAAAQQ